MAESGARAVGAGMGKVFFFWQRLTLRPFEWLGASLWRHFFYDAEPQPASVLLGPTTLCTRSLVCSRLASLTKQESPCSLHRTPC